MVRLYTELITIIQDNMQPQAGDKVERENLTMFDYKDKSAVISKLLDTNELFMEINVQIIESEKTRKKDCSTKGTSALFKNATRLMERASHCFKNIEIKPIANPNGATTTIFEHFMTAEEDVRAERDSKVSPNLDQPSGRFGRR